MSISVLVIPAWIRAILLVIAWVPGTGACTPNVSSSSPLPLPPESSADQVVPGEVLVQFRPGTTSMRIEEIMAATGARSVKSLGTPLVFIVRPLGERTAGELTARFREYNDVLYAEQNRVRRIEPPAVLQGTQPRSPTR